MKTPISKLQTISTILVATTMMPISSLFAQNQVAADPVNAVTVQQMVVDNSAVLSERLYKLRQNRPIWIQQGQWTKNAYYLENFRMLLESHGIDAGKYLPANLFTQIRSGSPSLDSAARLEAQITRSFVRALEHLIIGQINPEAVDGISIKRKSISDTTLQTISTQLDNAAKTDLAGLVQSVAPKHVAYERLRTALDRLQTAKNIAGAWRVPGTFKRVLQIGVTDPAVGPIKSQLVILGYQIENMNDTYDVQTEVAVRDVQLAMLMNPDGKIHPSGRTITYFRNIDSRISDIKMNLEKLRWFNNTPEQKHIFVNLANQTLRLYDLAQDSVNPQMAFRTINGRVDRKTPAMKDVITHLMLNPTWTVPNSIIWKDKAPELARLSADEMLTWFEEKGFTLYNLTFNIKLDPLSINWAGVNANNIDFIMVQSPRYDNALGVVKFPLTNPWAIYLHDTNSRNLFAESNRLRSSGCVRVEYPLELTEYLLAGTQWNRQALEDYLVKPEQKDAKQLRVNLPQRMPVYMIGLSSELDEVGVLRFPPDVYGQDALVRSFSNLEVLAVDNLSGLSLKEEAGF